MLNSNNNAIIGVTITFHNIGEKIVNLSVLKKNYRVLVRMRILKYKCVSPRRVIFVLRPTVTNDMLSMVFGEKRCPPPNMLSVKRRISIFSRLILWRSQPVRSSSVSSAYIHGPVSVRLTYTQIDQSVSVCLFD